MKSLTMALFVLHVQRFVIIDSFFTSTCIFLVRYSAVEKRCYSDKRNQALQSARMVGRFTPPRTIVNSNPGGGIFPLGQMGRICVHHCVARYSLKKMTGMGDTSSVKLGRLLGFSLKISFFTGCLCL